MVLSNTQGIIRAYYGTLPPWAPDPFPQPTIWQYVVPQDAEYAVFRRLTSFTGKSPLPSRVDMGLFHLSPDGSVRRLMMVYDSTLEELWRDIPYNLIFRPGEGLRAVATNIDTVIRTIGLSAYFEQVGGTIPGVLASDTFAGAAGSDLAAHVADTGQVWTIANGGWQLGGDGTAAPTNATVSNQALIAGPRGDCIVKATIVPGGNGPASLIGQWVDINNRYVGGLYTGGTPYAYVAMKINGTETQYRNLAFVPVKGQSYQVELRSIGKSLALLVDGTIQAAARLPTLLTGGLQGMYCDPLIGGNPKFSNFSVSEP